MTLLALADSAIDGTSPQGQRVACWLARSALEVTVEQLLNAKGITLDRSSMRSRLTVLQGVYVDDAAVAATAGYAWERLSDACHQHAYFLTPTATETRHLADLVRQLAARAEELEAADS